MKRKLLCSLLIIGGAVLLAAALLLLLNNREESAKAGEASAKAVSVIEAVIDESREQEEIKREEPITKTVPSHSFEENTVNINGYDYIGCIALPKLELKLSVMASCDYGRLAYSPCRQSGSAVSDDLVIAAHNFDDHFGRLKELESGDSVIFTDVDGVENRYCVEKLENLDPQMVEEVINSGYDLVLYTCTYGGGSRVTVFCSRTEG